MKTDIQEMVSAVNVAEVRTRFGVGCFILEDKRQGERATYGKQILKNLSIRLTERFGNDWRYDTLKQMLSSENGQRTDNIIQH